MNLRNMVELSYDVYISDVDIENNMLDHVMILIEYYDNIGDRTRVGRFIVKGDSEIEIEFDQHIALYDKENIDKYRKIMFECGLKEIAKADCTAEEYFKKTYDTANKGLLRDEYWYSYYGDKDVFKRAMDYVKNKKDNSLYSCDPVSYKLIDKEEIYSDLENLEKNTDYGMK